MAAHCRNIFGDMLLIDPLEGFAVSNDEKYYSVSGIGKYVLFIS